MVPVCKVPVALSTVLVSAGVFVFKLVLLSPLTNNLYGNPDSNVVTSVFNTVAQAPELLLNAYMEAFVVCVASKPLAPETEPVMCVPKPGFGLLFVVVVLLFTPSCQFARILVVVVTAEDKKRNALRPGINRSTVTLPLITPVTGPTIDVEFTSLLKVI